MSDHVHAANERALQPSTTGFDVNAAAAEVRAELSPAAAPERPRWTAADYGWDPADANAVAWAAYYSDLGVDPVALAAQQAAEAAPQATPAAELAPEPEPTLGPAAAEEVRQADPEPQPALELTPQAVEAEALAAPEAAASDAMAVAAEPLLTTDDPLLDDLSFAPVSTTDAPGMVDAGSAMWELLPAESPATGAPAEAELPHELPAGWLDDGRARLDDFQLASGGSFDETTAPIGDQGEPISGEQADAMDPLLPEVPPLDLGLAEDRLPTAAAPATAAPEPVAAAELLAIPDGDLAAPGAELSIDLGFFEDEPLEAAVAGLATEPQHDLGWAAYAVPQGDAAVDLASFDAEPQHETEPRHDTSLASEGTAMWGLGRAPAVPRSTAAEVLGDAAPLPIPASPPPSSDLGEPIDGSLCLEPVLDAPEPTAAAPLPPDPWDVPAAPASAVEVAPAAGAGPSDLDAPEVAPPAEPAEAILEVGAEVVEVTAEPVEPEPLPAPPAIAPAAPALAPEPSPAPANVHPAAADEPAAFEPPAPPVEEPLPGADLLAGLRADLAAPEPEPVAPAAAVPSSFIAGTHRVVVHTSDGQVKRGTLRNATLDGPELELWPQAGIVPESLQAQGVKAIFFMLSAGEPPPAPVGKKVRVTFRDGRQVAGFSPDYAPDCVGFFMVPADTRTHTARIWVYRASVRQVTVSP